MGSERFRGVVTAWDEEQGVGAVRLADGRAVWALFAAIDAPDGAFRELVPGEEVTLTVSEVAHGDYSWQADWIRRG
ncbi:hypothetical protein LEP48_10595 [Isoptericola sp. NEAU-Y5]|uniref:Uncharacterized protein n=1 Tax=Isoptericola luteus TaxID=2879484 RepID=A0ABS7ZJ38_9MICO|nr:hypothetical protein [Isoptericola sp. NEAU-Y5]MCA5893795.1 hypothetical protein [Isoptericola sp. NEAU-Y5]